MVMVFVEMATGFEPSTYWLLLDPSTVITDEAETPQLYQCINAVKAALVTWAYKQIKVYLLLLDVLALGMIGGNQNNGYSSRY